jgi:hypothetical protein
MCDRFMLRAGDCVGEAAVSAEVDTGAAPEEGGPLPDPEIRGVEPVTLYVGPSEVDIMVLSRFTMDEVLECHSGTLSAEL